MVARANDWKRVPFEGGIPIPFDAAYSREEFEKIRAGLIPEEMEDKWFIYFEEPHVFFHQSWTGLPVFRVSLAANDGGGTVIEALCVAEVLKNSSAEYQAKPEEPAAMKCLRIYATADGESHFDEVELQTTKRSVHPDAVPFEVSASYQASRVRFTRIPAGMRDVAWHTVPEPVLTVRLDGSVVLCDSRRTASCPKIPARKPRRPRRSPADSSTKTRPRRPAQTILSATRATRRVGAARSNRRGSRHGRSGALGKVTSPTGGIADYGPEAPTDA